MANLTYRASSPAAPASTTTKTTGLTNADVDGNFKSLDDAKYEKSGGTISGNLTVTGTSSLNSLSVTNTITGSISGNAATVTTNANLTGDVTSVGNVTTYTTVGTTKGGTNITSYAAGDVLYASAANTLSKLAKGSDGQVLKLSGGFPAWGTDNDTTYNIGDGALTVTSTAATTNVAITLALSGAYSANTATARSLDFKVGPALTNLATLMTTATAGFIRRSGQDSYSVDTSTYSLSSHGHYIGTTAVQSSSADQAVTGILSVTGGTASNFTLKTADVASAATGILYVKSGDVTAGNASSGAVSLNSGSGFGTQAAGSVSVYSGDGGLTSATGGSVSIQGGGSRAATSTGGNVSVRGGSALSTATTAATGGNVFILGGRTYNATGTRAGGNVYIDGGIDAATSSQYVATAGTVNIGNNASGVGGAGTSAVNIGSTSATTTIAGIIKLPTVGSSGFVKLGAGGQLSADTTTYATGSGTASGTNTGDQTIPTTLPNANAVTFNSSGGAAAGSTYTGAAALTVDYSTVGAAAAGHTHSYQAADGDLLAIGGLTGTSGFLKKTAADTWTLDTATYLTTYTDTNTITRLRGTASGTYNSGDLTLLAGTNVSITQSGTDYTINSSYTDTNTWNANALNVAGYVAAPVASTANKVWKTDASGNPAWRDDADTDTNTTYTASTGLTLTGTAFSVNYGTTSTTACVGNDSRLSNSRAASDVYAWAKASVKPAYALNEISSGALSASTGAFTGDVTITNNAGATLGVGCSTGTGNANLILGNSSNTSNPPTYSGIGFGVWAYGTLGQIQWANTGTATLDISANSSGSLITFTTTSTGYVKVKGTLASTSSTTGAFVVAGGVGIAGAVYTNSSITAADNITAYSDIKLKDNITTIDSALDKTLNLRGVYYTRKDINDKTRKVGVIAQEVQEVLPEVIKSNIDDVGDTTLSVDYGNITALLIEAIKELNAKVVELQNQLANK